jgi:hypothetical protein
MATVDVATHNVNHNSNNLHNDVVEDTHTHSSSSRRRPASPPNRVASDEDRLLPSQSQTSGQHVERASRVLQSIRNGRLLVDKSVSEDEEFDDHQEKNDGGTNDNEDDDDDDETVDERAVVESTTIPIEADIEEDNFGEGSLC